MYMCSRFRSSTRWYKPGAFSFLTAAPLGRLFFAASASPRCAGGATMPTTKPSWRLIPPPGIKFAVEQIARAEGRFTGISVLAPNRRGTGRSPADRNASVRTPPHGRGIEGYAIQYGRRVALHKEFRAALAHNFSLPLWRLYHFRVASRKTSCCQ